MSTFIGAAEAARILGVQRATLYAYVSRGLLTRRTAVDGRTSLYALDEVEQMAGRSRRPPTGPRPSIDVAIASAITSLDEHDLRYRGHAVAELAVSATFEQVAELLWTGTFDDEPPNWPAPTPGDVAAIDRVLHALGAGAEPLERLLVAATALGARHRDEPPTAAARRLLVHSPATVGTGVGTGAGTGHLDLRRPDTSRAGVDRADMGRPDSSAPPESETNPAATGLASAPPESETNPAATGLASALVAALQPTGRDPDPALAVAVQRALVLLADHELATSTLAVRVAASVRGDAWAAFAAGLATLRGRLHGSAAADAHRVLDEARTLGARAAIARRLDAGVPVAGFGHSIYRSTDPRFDVLLDAVRALDDPDDRLDVVDDVLAEAGRAVPVRPNVDLGLGALSFVAGLDPTVPLFAVARIAGWAAHLDEELLERPLRFRGLARAVR